MSLRNLLDVCQFSARSSRNTFSALRFLLSFLVFAVLVLCGAGSLVAQAPTPVPVLTWRYDLTHSGANTQETLLTPANVASSAFGKLFALPVDDRVFAQPLYVPDIKMSDGQAHNVLFVATENDSIYAFDADAKGAPIWQISLLTAAHGAGQGATPVPQTDVAPSEDIGPNIGITGTPAINLATDTMYVVANTKENGQYFSRLHAINIITGAEQPNSPVDITASAPGTGDASSGGQVPFLPLWTNQRAALNYYNGYVYIGYSSHGDISPYHGWLFAYDATTLKQTAALCLSPNDRGASLWGSGAGFPIDTSVSGGRMFVVTGNGARSTPFQSGSDYGQSVVAFNLGNGQLTPSDEWTAFNYQNLNTGDWDQGSGGLLMLPDQGGSYPHLIITAGKEGRITVLNRDSLGGFASGASSNTNAVQDIPLSSITPGQGFWGTAAYWNGNVYDWAGGDDGGTPNVGMQFKITNGVLGTTPASETTFTSAFPDPTFAVSSSGTTNGIVWAVKTDQFNTGGPAVLYAFDADDISQILYESDTKASDTAGPANKFSVPVVTNGKVYVAAKGEVDVYGLLNAQLTVATPVITPNGGSFASTQSVTIASSTPSAAIYYTLDGSTPTAASTLYAGPISVSTDSTVKAIATYPGYQPSSVSTATFTFTNQTPPLTVSPAGGIYLNAQSVTLTDTDASAKIYYTTDGSTPSAASTLYSGAIPVGASETIKAIAIDPALANSNIATNTYVIQTGGTSIGFSGGFPSASGLTLNGTAVINNNQLQLTSASGGTYQAGSAFWNAPINIQAFTTQFEFQLTNAQANGFTFTIQNGSPTQLGGSSAGLGYQNIAKSVAVKFNFYNYLNEGSDSTGIYTNGEAPVTPTQDISSSGIQLSSGHPVQAHITYDGTTLTLNLLDTVTQARFSWSQPINIPATVGGNTAYVGFTGGTGGLSATQDIVNWTYQSQAVPPAFSPVPGTYNSAQNVSLSSATGDAAIYYTTDGSTPTSSSSQYSAPIAVAASETINAIAISKTYGSSQVASGAYVIQSTQTAGTFSLSATPAGSVEAGSTATSSVTVTPANGFTGSVTLSCAVSGGPSGGAAAPTCSITQPAAISGDSPVMATLTVYSQAATTPGSYNVTVTGTWGSQQSTTTVAVAITGGTSASPSFSLTSSSATAGQGGNQFTSTITIAPANGFTGTVTLACALTNGPTGATNPPGCSVTQPAAITGAQSVTATLTVSVPGAATAMLHHGQGAAFGWAGGGTLAAAFFFICLPIRRRRWAAMMGMIAFATLAMAVSGCGSGNPVNPPGGPGTTPGSYTFTVTGSSGSQQTTTTVAVSIP